MTEYTARIQKWHQRYDNQTATLDKIQELINQYNKGLLQLNQFIEASRILVTVTDLNTHKVTSFIENIINKALNEMYPSGEYYIRVQKDIARNNPKIEVFLYDSDNKKDTALDLSEQAGDGVSRIIAFIFSLSLIELSGGRKFVSLDEVLTGFHSDSLIIIKNIITIFKQGGFQFIASEYDINDMGVIYEGKKVGKHLVIEELGMAEEIDYQRTLI